MKTSIPAKTTFLPLVIKIVACLVLQHLPITALADTGLGSPRGGGGTPDDLGGGMRLCTNPAPGCQDQEIEIICCTPEQMGQYCGGNQKSGGCTDVHECKLYLPQFRCDETGLGGNYPPGRHPKSPFPAEPPTRKQVLSWCTVEHELQHLYDGCENTCAAEKKAFQTTTACYERYQEAYCKAGANPDFCNALKKDLCFYQGAVELNKCRCEVGSFEKGEPCDGCVQECIETMVQCGASLKGAITNCGNLACVYCHAARCPECAAGKCTSCTIPGQDTACTYCTEEGAETAELEITLCAGQQSDGQCKAACGDTQSFSLKRSDQGVFTVGGVSAYLSEATLTFACGVANWTPQASGSDESSGGPISATCDCEIKETKTCWGYLKEIKCPDDADWKIMARVEIAPVTNKKMCPVLLPPAGG